MNYTAANIKLWSRLGSCGAYGSAAMELPELDDTMVACTADLRFYSGLDRFSKKYPDRLYNVGIAEQNLVGIAGGLAKEGVNPFASTYASFCCTRALDQVRVNMGYMQLPIKLIGLTAGLSVGILGATHMSIEDVAILRSIPNITIISPADGMETVKATLALANYPHPVYLRLTGSMNAPIVYHEDYDFQIGKAITLREGTQIAILACGSMVSASLSAAGRLAQDGISAAVINIHTIKPLDVDCLEGLKGFERIVTVEEHSVIGGLGSCVAEFLAERTGFPPLQRIGLSDHYPHAGDYGYLLAQNGLTAEAISLKIKAAME